MSNLATRAITGALYVIITIGVFYLGGLYVPIFLAIICGFCIYEGYKMGNKLGLKNAILNILIYPALLMYLGYFEVPELKLLHLILALLIHVAIAYAIVNSLKTNPNPPMILLTLYIWLPLVVLSIGYKYLENDSRVFSLFLGYFVIVWLHDTFAYLIGRKIGRIKLAPKVSPKKSTEDYWEV